MPTAKLPLSVLIVTHRFDERFDQCLESVSWAQEILVASSLTPPSGPRPYKLVVAPPVVNFAAARNGLLAKATQPWVLCLDSDEVLPAGSAALVEKLMSDTSVAGYSMGRRDMFWGRWVTHGEVGQFKQIRMAQKGRIRFSRPVHEEPAIKGQIKRSGLVIDHYPHPTLKEFIDSVTRYSQMEAAFRRSKGQTSGILSLLTYPIGKFLHSYLWLRGWQDGVAGLAYAVVMSIHSYSVRIMTCEKS